MVSETDYFAAQRYLRWRLFLLIFGAPIILIPIILAHVYRLLSDRALNVVLISYVVCTAVAVTLILRSARARFKSVTGTITAALDDEMRSAYHRRIRSLQFCEAFFALVLLFGLWATSGGPWLPRIVGVTMNLLIQFALIQSIRRLKKELQRRV